MVGDDLLAHIPAFLPACIGSAVGEDFLVEVEAGEKGADAILAYAAIDRSCVCGPFGEHILEVGNDLVVEGCAAFSLRGHFAVGDGVAVVVDIPSHCCAAEEVDHLEIGIGAEGAGLEAELIDDIGHRFAVGILELRGIDAPVAEVTHVAQEVVADCDVGIETRVCEVKQRVVGSPCGLHEILYSGIGEVDPGHLVGRELIEHVDSARVAAHTCVGAGDVGASCAALTGDCHTCITVCHQAGDVFLRILAEVTGCDGGRIFRSLLQITCAGGKSTRGGDNH